ncbi:outer membrane beta-barrel protein [Pedobacter sp. SD-b]|uniref:Outer membrane beta-barrel protein n=1 Tax=Pedobacter segetis TaxID=2793069 RepID=A0ABS1BII8_9SPHI|nr:outer membrane beta-barrel protein [Pedobacter segetis]
MKQKFFLKSIKISIVLILITTSVFSQTGKIAGKVTDKKTGETLIGLSIGIEGTNKGSATDVEGRFVIPNLIPGKYNVTFRYIGYQTKSITGVEVKSGAVTSLNIIMEDAATQALNEVVVTASYRKASVGALYAQQKNNISISSGISSDIIKRSPDKNTSEVLKRVSGASIQDNKFIVVRGLSDRYNSAMLNNAVLPNTEVDRKAFSFDIIPSNLIDAIVVNKTASADIPGDFSGGVVQVTTKDFPDSKFLNLSLGTSYNTQSTFKDFLTAPKSGNEIFGFYDKGRDIPSSFPSKAEYLALPSQGPERFELSRAFKNNWGYNNVTSKLGPIFQANYGNSKIYDNNNKFGTILSLSYRYDERLKDVNQIAYTGQNVGDKFNDQVYSYNTNIGGLANFAYSWGNNKIALKNLYNRVLESQFTNRIGVDESSQPFSRTANYLLQRSLISDQLSGEHLLSEARKVKLDWNLNYANTDRKEPGFKRMEYSQGIASVPNGSSDPRLGGNFSSLLNENSYGAATNVVFPVKWFRDNNKLKFGYFGQLRKRNFKARVIGFIKDVNFDDNAALSLPQDQIFAADNIRPKGFVLDEITNGSDAYDSRSLLNAGYVMFDGFVKEKLRVGAGVRLESYRQQLTSADNSYTPIIVDTTYVNVLPSVNLIYNLTEKSNFRLSGSKTIGRPEFREIAPFSFYDFNKNISVQGNSKLKQSSTINLDLGFATYPNNGETFSISAFFKSFDLPIEQTLQLGTSGRTVGYSNAKSATLFGVEAEIRKSLGFIGDRFKNITFSANASYIKSRVVVSKLVNKDGFRPLQGQSPYLINTGLQYISPSINPFGLSLLYNRIGKRIYAVGNVLDGDIYENPRNILDFQLSKKVANSKGEFKINYSDILNNKGIFYQDANKNGSFDKNSDYINISERYGSSVSLSFAYTFK